MMSTHSRIRRASMLENHPVLVLLILLLWEPFSTSFELWDSLKKRLQHFWAVHYLAPKEQAPPRSSSSTAGGLFRTGSIDRPLTPPLEHPRRVGSLLKSKKQQTHLQAQCVIFALPPEIRMLVYKEVLGGYCAYPIDKQNWWYLQKKMVDRNARHVAWSLSQPSPKLYDEKHGFIARPHLLALPLTCRRMYAFPYP